MAKTLADLVQDACDELGLPRLPNVIGNSDAQARRMLALANRQGRDLVTQHDWVELQRVNVFPTVSGQSEYALPDDYARLVIDTIWNRSQLTPIKGPIQPATWQSIKSGLIGTGLYYQRYRLMRPSTGTGKIFSVDPAPSNDGDELAFEYLSRNWCELQDKSQQNDEFQNDTDLVLLDSDLMLMGLLWRWQKANGLEFTTQLAEYNERLDNAKATNAPASGISMVGPVVTQAFIGYPNIPETGYGGN